MRIADLMTAPPVTVTPGATADEAARRMDEQQVGCLLVADRGVLCGVLTDRDLVVRGLARGAGPDTPVSELMSVPGITVDAASAPDAAYRAFRRTGVRRLAVLDGRQVVGVLSIDDLFQDVLFHLADLLGPVSWSALREGSPGRTD